MDLRRMPRLFLAASRLAANRLALGGAAATALVGVLVLWACGQSDTPPPGQSAAATAASSGPSASEARAVAGHGLGGGDPGEGPSEAASADPSIAAPGSAEPPDGPTPELDRETYVVRVNAPPSAAQGEGGITEIHVIPKDGWKMNHDFPMLLTVTAPDGVSIEGAEQEIADAVHYSDERGEWAVRFTPEAGGEKAFEADFRFAVCTDEVCIPKREKLAWVVEVE
jgi:hypothetical protein